LKTLAPVDACIVGSGASGSVMAAELSAAGFKVVVLEIGEATDPERIPTAQPDWELRRNAFFPAFRGEDRVSYAPDSEPTFRVSRFKGIGGSTMHFEGFYTRMHPGDWRRRSETGLSVDWPIRYDELVPFYDRVESRIGVSGTTDNPFEPARTPYPEPALAMSCAVQRVKSGCDRLGLHAAHAPMAILSRPRPGRGSCNFCGGCWFGCMHGAIGNAAQTFLAEALHSGAEVRSRCAATRVVTNATGRRVRGVEYLDAEGNLWLQEAGLVVLCGSAIETPRLLLMSAQVGHPDGLANQSGQVGRHFTIHTHASVRGWFDDPVDAYKGPNINGMVQDFWEHREDRAFAGGYVIALRNAELGPYTHFQRHIRDPNLFGAALHQAMETGFGHTATISAYGEHFATEEDRITLDSGRTDGLGLPVPQVRVQLRDNEEAMLTHMNQTLRDIMEAAGARRVETATPSRVLGTHLMGTCRMGTDPDASVVDTDGKAHGVENLYVADGSVFPTSTPANPTLTIQAMALRIAEGMIGNRHS
jgi:choline dehydrogenase-like flavoprotein